MSDAPHDEQFLPLHFGLFIFGGVSLGIGILFLFWSFGFDGGAINQNISSVGYSATDNIGFLPSSDIVAIPLIVLGLFSMVFGNATAWRSTGGY